MCAFRQVDLLASDFLLSKDYAFRRPFVQSVRDADRVELKIYWGVIAIMWVKFAKLYYREVSQPEISFTLWPRHYEVSPLSLIL